MLEVLFVLCEYMQDGQSIMKKAKVLAENKRICYNKVCFDALLVQFEDVKEAQIVIENSCSFTTDGEKI